VAYPRLEELDLVQPVAASARGGIE
jgi:hypothetical protein